jgi:hypothetical protein
MYRLAVFELTISNFLAMQFVEMMARWAGAITFIWCWQIQIQNDTAH